MRLAFWIDGEEPVGAFSATGRLHAFDSFECHVQQAALTAVRRRKGIRYAALAHLLRGGFGR